MKVSETVELILQNDGVYVPQERDIQMGKRNVNVLIRDKKNGVQSEL